jgi:hypothetical protein
MSSYSRDLALDALFHPFNAGLLRWPADSVLFLRAREGAALHAQPHAGMVVTQPFKPEADRLARIGMEIGDEAALPVARFPLVLVLPPRQREEARALFAKASAAVAAGGVIVVAVTNDEGAKSREADLKLLTGSVSVASKHHCRVFWTAPGAAIDAASQAQWAVADAPRTITAADVPGGSFQTRPGVVGECIAERSQRARGGSWRGLGLPDPASAGEVSASDIGGALRGRRTRAGLGQIEPSGSDAACACLLAGCRRGRAGALRRHRLQSTVPCVGPR